MFRCRVSASLFDLFAAVFRSPIRRLVPFSSAFFYFADGKHVSRAVPFVFAIKALSPSGICRFPPINHLCHFFFFFARIIWVTPLTERAIRIYAASLLKRKLFSRFAYSF